MNLSAPLTVDQAAELLRCAPKTVQARARAGDLPGLKWGEDWIFPAGAFFARLDQIALDKYVLLRDAYLARRKSQLFQTITSQLPTDINSSSSATALCTASPWNKAARPARGFISAPARQTCQTARFVARPKSAPRASCPGHRWRGWTTCG